MVSDSISDDGPFFQHHFPTACPANLRTGWVPVIEAFGEKMANGQDFDPMSAISTDAGLSTKRI
jgi:hypothetical protein